MAISPGFWTDFRMIFASNCAGIIGSYRVIRKKIPAWLHYSLHAVVTFDSIQTCWTNPPQRFHEFPAMENPVARWCGWSVAAEHRSAGLQGQHCSRWTPNTPWVVRHASIHVPSPSTWDLGVSDVLVCISLFCLISHVMPVRSEFQWCSVAIFLPHLPCFNVWHSIYPSRSHGRGDHRQTHNFAVLGK